MNVNKVRSIRSESNKLMEFKIDNFMANIMSSGGKLRDVLF